MSFWGLFRNQKKDAHQGPEDAHQGPEETKMLDKQWRELNFATWDEKTLHNLREFVRNYVPAHGLKYANILLLGPANSGKSSFLNTVQSCLQESECVSRRAEAGSRSFAFTKRFHTYKMMSAPKKLTNFRIYDVRGMQNVYSIQTDDVKAILDGHIKNGYTINPEKAIDETDPKYRRNPKHQQRIHCIVWCFDASVGYDENSQIKDIQISAQEKGIGQMVLITKIDQLEKIVEKEVQKAFFSNVIRESVKKFAFGLGLPENCILPMKNYAAEITRHTETEILALCNLKQILKVVDDFLLNLIDDEDDSDSVDDQDDEEKDENNDTD